MKLDFTKGNGLIPAIIQDADTQVVLMLGYVNEAALERTRETGRMTFFSRSKQRLWTKGETSGNFLTVVSMAADCDGDTVLVQARPSGPVCHTGSETCFGAARLRMLDQLDRTIADRQAAEPESSYTARLFAQGTARIAQKVGEEATETVIEAIRGNREKLAEEAADLLYHLLVLLRDQNLGLQEVEAVLRERHAASR